MADVDVLIRPPDHAAPLNYVVSNVAEIVPKSVRAVFDGTGAAGPFLPCLVFVSPQGHEIARCPVRDPVAAGADVEVTWAPFLDEGPVAAGCPDPFAATGIAAVMIGSGTGSGHTLTITLTANAAYVGLVHVICAVYSDDPVNFGGPNVETVSDSRGHTWEPPTSLNLPPYSVIGQVAEGGGVSGVPGLSAGPTFITGVSPSAPLCAGDTITVGFQPGFPGNHIVDTVGIAIAQVGLSATADGQTIFGGGLNYVNGDSFPGNGGSPDLSWNVDYGGTLTPNPVDNAALIACAAAYPGAPPYTPLNGYKVAEVTSQLTLAVSAQLVVEAGADLDPGGSWTGAPSVTVGNYQFAQLL